MGFAIIVALAIWIFALINLCWRRDLDVHDKISWVVTLLVLNVVGAVIYLVFAPKQPVPADHPDLILSGDRHNLGERSSGEE